MQPQKQKQDQVFFEFLICKKQKEKQMFFGLFSFIKQELNKTKHKLSQSKPKRDRISSINFNYAPKPYKAKDSKVNKSNGRLKTQSNSLEK